MSAAVLGSIDMLMTGSGKVVLLQDDRMVLVAQRVAGERVLDADDGDDVARLADVERDAVWRVHLEHAADVFLACRCWR